MSVSFLDYYAITDQTSNHGPKYNTAGQRFHFFVYNSSGRVTGWEVMVVCHQSIDGGTMTQLNDAVPVEIGNTGEYYYELTQAETNGHELSWYLEVPEPLYGIDGEFLIGPDGRGLSLAWGTPDKWARGTPASTQYTTKQYEIYESLFGAAP